MSLESLAEAGEGLCGPDIGRELFHCSAKTEKSCDWNHIFYQSKTFGGRTARPPVPDCTPPTNFNTSRLWSYVFKFSLTSASMTSHARALRSHAKCPGFCFRKSGHPRFPFILPVKCIKHIKSNMFVLSFSFSLSLFLSFIYFSIYYIF